METLPKMVSMHPETLYYVDSALREDIEYGLARGASGVTTNPAIIAAAILRDGDRWKKRAVCLKKRQPDLGPEEIADLLHRELVCDIADRLLPVYKASPGGWQGRVAVQVNPFDQGDSDKMILQAQTLFSMAPNLLIKLPATAAGIQAMEECTRRGISVVGTVSFTTAQAVAIAKAVERGLAKRRREGLSCNNIAAACVIMVGRLDDWLRKSTGLSTPTADAASWAGVAVIKQTYGILCRRGYPVRVLGAACRSRQHWAELVGGRLLMTMSRPFQEQINSEAACVESRIHSPVPGNVMEALRRDYPDFQRAWLENGLAEDEFEQFGASRQTLQGFQDEARRLHIQVGEWISSP